MHDDLEYIYRLTIDRKNKRIETLEYCLENCEWKRQKEKQEANKGPSFFYNAVIFGMGFLIALGVVLGN